MESIWRRNNGDCFSFSLDDISQFRNLAIVDIHLWYILENFCVHWTKNDQAWGFAKMPLDLVPGWDDGSDKTIFGSHSGSADFVGGYLAPSFWSEFEFVLVMLWTFKGHYVWFVAIVHYEMEWKGAYQKIEIKPIYSDSQFQGSYKVKNTLSAFFQCIVDTQRKRSPMRTLHLSSYKPGTTVSATPFLMKIPTVFEPIDNAPGLKSLYDSHRPTFIKEINVG